MKIIVHTERMFCSHSEFLLLLYYNLAFVYFTFTFD